MQDPVNDAKEFLEKTVYANKFARSSRHELKQVIALIRQMKVLHAKGSRCFSETIRKLQLNGQVLVEEIRQLEGMEAERAKVFESLKDDTMITLLKLRYVDQLQWQGIADKMHYSKSALYLMHKEALMFVFDFIMSANESSA